MIAYLSILTSLVTLLQVGCQAAGTLSDSLSDEDEATVAECSDSSNLGPSLEDWADQLVDSLTPTDTDAIRKLASEGTRRIVVQPAQSCPALGDSIHNRLQAGVGQAINRAGLITFGGRVLRPLELAAEGGDIEVKFEWHHDSMDGRDLLIVRGTVHDKASKKQDYLEEFSVDACELTDRQRKCLLQ